MQSSPIDLANQMDWDIYTLVARLTMAQYSPRSFCTGVPDRTARPTESASEGLQQRLIQAH